MLDLIQPAAYHCADLTLEEEICVLKEEMNEWINESMNQ